MNLYSRGNMYFLCKIFLKLKSLVGIIVKAKTRTFITLIIPVSFNAHQHCCCYVAIEENG